MDRYGDEQGDQRADQWTVGGTVPDMDETWIVPPDDLDATWPVQPNVTASTADRSAT